MLEMLERLKTKASKVFCFIFHAGFKISNFNVWTSKHLMQASWTELALHICTYIVEFPTTDSNPKLYSKKVHTSLRFWLESQKNPGFHRPVAKATLETGRARRRLMQPTSQPGCPSVTSRRGGRRGASLTTYIHTTIDIEARSTYFKKVPKPPLKHEKRG